MVQNGTIPIWTTSAPAEKTDCPENPQSESRERLGWEWVDWTGPIRRLAELDADLEKLAGKLPSLRPKLLAEARTAQVAEALML